MPPPLLLLQHFLEGAFDYSCSLRLEKNNIEYYLNKEKCTYSFYNSQNSNSRFNVIRIKRYACRLRRHGVSTLQKNTITK